LREFTNELASDIGIGAVDAHGHMIVPDDKIYGEYTDLLAQCHVELGQWQASLKVPGEPVSPFIFLGAWTIAESAVGPDRLDP
jgi:FKBP12-rapamycin complex-associated protein